MHTSSKPAGGAGPSASTAGALTHRDLWTPWPAAWAGAAVALEDSARAFAVAQGLIKNGSSRRFDAVNVGLLTAMAYPRAPFERQQVIAAFFGWIFLQDDDFDDRDEAHDPERLRQRLEGYHAILRGERVPEGGRAALRALQAFRDAVVVDAEPAWFDWFCESMRSFWLDGVVEEARARDLGITPTIEQYIRVRIASVCMLPAIDLAEWAQGPELTPLPRLIVADPSLQRVRELAALVVAFANDVFSFEMERKNGDPNNLVLLHMFHDGMSLPEAVDAAVRTHNDTVRRFEEAVRQIPDVGDALRPALSRHVEACRRWMRGACDWERRSVRYADALAVLDEGAATIPAVTSTVKTTGRAR
jgi:hypothetical protein